MPKKERTHETVNGLPSLELLTERVDAGWKLIGLEWERDAPANAGAEPESAGKRGWIEEIPYGLRVSDDCSRMAEAPRRTRDHHHRPRHDRAKTARFHEWPTN